MLDSVDAAALKVRCVCAGSLMHVPCSCRAVGGKTRGCASSERGTARKRYQKSVALDRTNQHGVASAKMMTQCNDAVVQHAAHFSRLNTHQWRTRCVDVNAAVRASSYRAT